MALVRNQQGLTLIELMVSMVLGLLVIGATLGVFAQVKRSYNENDRILQMQDDARFALRELSRDLSMSGFWGQLSDPGSVTADTSLTVATDCGAGVDPWAYDFNRPLTTVDNATAASATAEFSCITGATVVPGTDIVGIKRTEGNGSALPLDAGVVYLKSNGVVGLMLQHPESAAPPVVVPAPMQHWRYVPSIWFIRTHWDDTDRGDGITSLCRKRLDDSGAPTMIEECLVPGVEDLQLEFGIDNDADGIPDRYVTDPTADELNAVLTIRAALLMRSIVPQQGYMNDKLYQLSNNDAFRPNDSFYRRVHSNTVTVRNLRNQSRF